jgi:hypothetical protein
MVAEGDGKLKRAAEWLKDYLSAVREAKLHPFTKTERKARSATKDIPW